MVKALILYTNGKYEEKALKDLEAYQEVVKGSIEMLPVKRGYVNPSVTTKRKLLCYVNEEGMIAQLPSNPWGGLLQVLGVAMHPAFPIFGNVIVFSESKDGDEGPVDSYVVSLAKEYKDCEDEDAFFVALEKLNERKAVVNNKKKRNEEPAKEEKESKKKAKSTVECSCNDETKEETKKCAACACLVNCPMSESTRKAECSLHKIKKPVLICGECDFFCGECEILGWESDAGKGGGSTVYNTELNLKIKNGKQVALSQ